jgi:Family of unknown function (DUF6504)
MAERFIGEALVPVGTSFDAGAMASGAPGVPHEFAWRDERLAVTGVLASWRETGACRNGSGERYVRKHWFSVATGSGETARIYFERQARGGRGAPRWWLYSLGQDPTPGGAERVRRSA